MNSVKISVIICTYNRKSVLERVLTAYKKQTFRDFEIILASDGASDGTDEMVSELGPSLGYRLTYIRQEDNGFRKSLAVNKAVRESTGQILIFADDDMIPPPHFLESYEKIYRSASDPDRVLVYSKYIPIVPDDKLFTMENIVNGEFMNRYTLHWRMHFLYWKIKYLLYFQKKHPLRPKLNGGNFSVSAAAFRAINGLDSDFVGWGYEDDDLRRRLLVYGVTQKEAVCSAWLFNLGYVPESKTTFGSSENRAAENKKLAYDKTRPARCVRGMMEAEAAEIPFRNF